MPACRTQVRLAAVEAEPVAGRPGRRRRSPAWWSWPLVALARSRPATPTAALAGAALRRGGGRRRHRPRLRRRVRRSSSAAAWPPSTATTTGCPTCTSPAAAEPAALYRNESPIGGALRFDRLADPGHRPDRRSPAPTRSTSTATASTDLAVLRLGENVLLRGLGDCRFERANEAWAFDGGDDWTTAFSATWEGGATLPTLAFGNYLDARRDRRRTSSCCADNELVRPAARRRGYAPPDAADARLLHALDAVQRLGPLGPARPAGDQRPPLLPTSDGEEQLWRIDGRRAAAAVHARRRLADAADLGHGHRQPGPHRRRLPGGLPDQPGRQQAADARRRRRPSRLPRHRPERGVTAHRPFAGGDTCPRPPGTPSSRTSTTTASWTCSSPRATSRRMPDYAAKDPSNLLLGQPDGTFVEGAEAAGIVDFDRGRGARRSSTSTSTGCSTSSRSTARENVKVWRNVGAGDAAAPGADGPLARPSSSSRPAPNRDAIGAWIEVRVGDRTIAARADRRRRPRRRPARLDPLRARRGRPRPRSGSVAGRRGRPVDAAGGRPVRDHRARRDEVRPWTPGEPTVRRLTMTGGAAGRRRAARLRHARRRCRSIPPAHLRARLERLRERAEARGYDRLVVYADREHSANLALPDRLRPALRGGVLVVGPSGEPAILVGNECFGMAGAAPLPMRRDLFQDLSLPGQPRDRSRPLADDPRRRGHRRRARASASSAGRRTPTATTIEVPPSSSTSCARLVGAGRAGRERQRPAHRRRRRAARRSTRSTSSPPSSRPPARPRDGVARPARRPAAGHDRAGGGRACSAGTARRSPAT